MSTRRIRTAPICGWSIRSSPKLQGDLAAWFGSVPAVPAACKGNALLTDEGCETNGFDEFRQDQVLEDAGRQMRDSAEACVPYYRWVTDYIAMIGGR